jgi:hypothetical protein
LFPRAAAEFLPVVMQRSLLLLSFSVASVSSAVKSEKLNTVGAEDRIGPQRNPENPGRRLDFACVVAMRVVHPKRKILCGRGYYNTLA